MILKQPTPCCGSPVLNWDKKKWNFVCPCGRMRADELGREIDKAYAGGRRPRGRPRKNKGERMLAQTNGGVPLREEPDYLDRYGLEGLDDR